MVRGPYSGVYPSSPFGPKDHDTTSSSSFSFSSSSSFFIIINTINIININDYNDYCNHDYIENAHVFSTIGGDGSRQYRSDATIFAWVFPVKPKFLFIFELDGKFATVKQRVWALSQFI